MPGGTAIDSRYAGFIVNCDIIGFSKKSTDEQIACVRHLAQTSQDSAGRMGIAETCRFIGTGDGFFLTVDNPQVRHRPSVLLDLLDEVSAAAAAAQPTYSFRCGIHEGKYNHLELFGYPNAIGDGLNVTSRVAALGDASHVLVSETFANSLEKDPAFKRKLVDLGTKLVKHRLAIRVFKVDGFGNSEIPRSFVRDQKFSFLIFEQICELYDVFIQAFQAETGLTDSELGIRLSLLLPDPEGKHLFVSDQRFDPFCQMEEASNALFPIGENDDGSRREIDIAGFAHRTNKLAFVDGLPDGRAGLEGYWKAYCKKGKCDVPIDYVRAWRRRSRALLDIPFDLNIIGERAILAADFLSDLRTVPRKCRVSPSFLTSFAEKLALNAGYLPILQVLLQASR